MQDVAEQQAEPNQPDQPKQRDGITEQPLPGNLPPGIVLAFNFVHLCNQNMGLRGFCVSDSAGEHHCRVATAELHPVQEGAFRLACMALGSYFAAHVPALRMTDCHTTVGG